MVTILTLCAMVESVPSFTTARRILRVRLTSPLAFDCLPAVIASGARSRVLTAALSGATGVDSCAIATVPAPNNAENRIKLYTIFFILGDPPFSFQSTCLITCQMGNMRQRGEH